MINLKKLLTNILTTLNAKVNRSGDIMSGDISVAIPDASSAASVGARCGTAANPTSWAVLQASTSGNAGVYDNKHNKWMVRSDADGTVHVPSTLTTLSTSKVMCAKVSTTYQFANVPALAKWNMVAVRFAVHENVQVLFFVRGERIERSLTDWPSAGKFRGGIWIDWNNNRIGMRCLNAGNNGNHTQLVYFDLIYGVF